MELEIKISNETIDSIIDRMIEQGSIKGSKDLDVKKNEIIKEAKKIISSMKSNKSKYQKLLSLLKSREQKTKQINDLLKKDKDTIDTVAVEKLANEKRKLAIQFYQDAYKNDYANKIYKEVLSFQGKLNNIIGQKQVLAYVVPNLKGSSPIIYELDLSSNKSIKQFLNTRFNKDTFTGSFSLSKKKLDASEYAKEINGKEYETDESLGSTYKEIIRRYDNSKNKSKELKNSSLKGWVLWKTDRVDGIRIGQRGDINEAYASFFYRTIQWKNFNNIEYQIEHYAMEGIKKVDSVSGLLQGDIRKENGIEIAVKSEGASMLSFNQIISMAEKINNEWANLDSKSFIKKILEEQIYLKKKGEEDSENRHKILTSLEEEVKKDIIDSLGNYLTN